MSLYRLLARSGAALVFALVLAPALASAEAARWEIDSAHSSADFTVRHMMVTNVRGTFGKLSGFVLFDSVDPTRSSVEATIDATTIDTREEKRNEHLKSADFFDVAKFPTMTFKSTKVESVSPGKLKVTGDLTMHGVTKPVTLDVDGPAAPVGGQRGKKSGVSASTKLDRKDFGIVWNKALDAGGVAVSDEVAVTIDLELNQKAPEPAPAAEGAAAGGK